MHEEPYRQIPLYRRDGTVRATTIVDPVDYAELEGHRWFLNSNGYAVRSVWGKGTVTVVLMHRQILGLVAGDGLQADHINRDRLDNRRANLRVVTLAENCLNVPSRRGAHRGVHWQRDRRKWRARVGYLGLDYHLGYFDDEEVAAEAVRQWYAERGVMF